MNDRAPADPDRFPATRHTVIDDLKSGEVAVRERAWSALLEAYRTPVIAYLRFSGHRSTDECEDLAHAFFARAMEKDFFASFDHSKARFRTFLRTCLEAFVMNADRARYAQKRDARAVRSIDADATDLPEADPKDPARAFDTEWVRGILMGAIDELEAFCAKTDRMRDFLIFRRYDVIEIEKDDAPPTYASLAAEFATDVTTITNRLHAARRELRKIVLDRIRRVTATEEEFRDEVRSVLGIDP